MFRFWKILGLGGEWREEALHKKNVKLGFSYWMEDEKPHGNRHP